MSSNPPPSRDPSDDWHIPKPDSPSGKWESDEVQPAARQRQTFGSLLKPLVDVLRGPFGALWDDPRGRPLILVSLVAIIGVCALGCFIVSLALISNINPSPGPIDRTAIAEATQPISTSLIVHANNTPIPASVPNRLTIGNSAFTVVATRPDEKGQWPYDRNAQKTAYWVVGTLVNYVVGLPASDANRATFNSLQLNELIVLDTTMGTLRYRVAQTQTVKADEQAPLLAQSSPQLTLVLLGEGGDDRHILVARYTDEGTPNSVTSIGVPVNLGDVRVTALNSRMLPGTSVGLPADRNYFQVNIEVTSLITRHLDASQFTAQLIDSAGNRYSLSSQGSFAAGGSGWTQGVLAPGTTLTATAGFEVPASMPGPKLEWDFSIEKDNPYMARVNVPYEPLVVQPTTQATSAPVAEVALLNVNITPEGNELRIVGTVHNLTDKFLPVSLRDISLASGTNLSALNSSLPAFPWSVTPGETLAFQLTFARPPGGSPAIFTLFGQSFEISGL
jgi:hypothetical protein